MKKSTNRTIEDPNKVVTVRLRSGTRDRIMNVSSHFKLSADKVTEIVFDNIGKTQDEIFELLKDARQKELVKMRSNFYANMEACQLRKRVEQYNDSGEMPNGQ